MRISFSRALSISLALHFGLAAYLYYFPAKNPDQPETPARFSVNLKKKGFANNYIYKPEKKELPPPKGFTDVYTPPVLSMAQNPSEERQQKKTLHSSAGEESSKNTRAEDNKVKEGFKKQFGKKHKGQMQGFSQQEYEKLLDNLNKAARLNSKYKPIYEYLLPERNVPEPYIHRDRAYDELVSKDVFPTLPTIDQNFSRTLGSSQRDLKKYKTRNKIIEDFKTWSSGRSVRNTLFVNIVKEGKQSRRGPLHMSPPDRSKYLLDNYLLPKESQLDRFVDTFMLYDPDKGDLPLLARELFYDNLLRVVYRFSTDQSYFLIDFYLENLNKEDYLKKILYQVSRIKGTKTATELLFSIQNIYETQLNAWKSYFDYLEDKSPRNDDRLRHQVIKALVDKYDRALKTKNIRSYQDASNLYTTRRIEIMNYIIRTTPGNYRQADAIFTKARIHWQRGRTHKDKNEFIKALRLIESIDPSQSTGDFIFRNSYQAVLNMVSQVKAHGLNLVTESQISHAFNLDIGRFVQEKMAREKQHLWSRR